MDRRVLMWRPGGGLRWQLFVKEKTVDDDQRGVQKQHFKPILTLACHPKEEWVVFSESVDMRVMSTSQTLPIDRTVTKKTMYVRARVRCSRACVHEHACASVQKKKKKNTNKNKKKNTKKKALFAVLCPRERHHA